MKFSLHAFIIFLFSISMVHAEKPGEKPMTAFEVLAEAKHQLGKFGKEVLSMESENSHLRPRYWWIRFYDDSLFMKTRAVQMIGPEMMKNMEPGNPFDSGNREFVIQPDLLKYDSEKCIAFIEKAAKDSGIPLSSLNAKLEKPHPGESNPIWFFELFNAEGEKLGKINISATTGKVTEIIGLKLKDKRFDPVSKNTPSQDVESTFLGVGADLEETFTGKRTIDKDGSDSEKTSSKSSKSASD
jgi:hypothetical protein